MDNFHFHQLPCRGRWMLVTGLFLLAAQPGFTDAMTLDNLKDTQCPQHNTTKCLDGSCCVDGKQYCSDRSGTCEDSFPRGYNDSAKLAKCCQDIIIDNSATQELEKACYYLFGRLSIRDHCIVPRPVSCDCSTVWILFGLALLFIVLSFAFVFGVWLHIKFRQRRTSGQSDEEKNVKGSTPVSHDKDKSQNMNLNIEAQSLLQHGEQRHVTPAPTSPQQESPFEGIHDQQPALPSGRAFGSTTINGFSPTNDSGAFVVAPSGSQRPKLLPLA
ncbi:unnamed protein product [Lymnaea stagnalis]|uniref:Uncharacterized protein n=1 Tax=Lymnaea stagnalis TaxID=6523 RepID=A0AAV2H2P9_LYMST